jgi:hypothetical protein
MKSTALVSNVEKSSFDGGLVSAVSARSVAFNIAAAMSLRIAIRNEDGDIYRVIGINDSDDFFLTVRQLVALNFFDELSDEDQPGNGYHAIFIR